MSVWIQVNLLFFACAVILLYVNVTPVEAEACGYHYHYNEYYTVYYSTYYKRYHPLYYGYCTSGYWTSDGKVYNTYGERLYYIITYYYGKVPTVELQTETQGYLKMSKQKDVEANDTIQKRIQVSDYAEILKTLVGQKRAERAFQKADYCKVSKNSAVKKEAEETKEKA